MAQNQQSMRKLDTALLCLVSIARILGVPADAGQLKRAFVVSPDGMMDRVQLLRAAMAMNLKARLISAEALQLLRLPKPAIAILKNGNYVVVGRCSDQKVVLIDPYQPRPMVVPLGNFLKAWSGDIILFTRRFKLKEAVRKFNLGWFIPVMIKYRRFFGEVILASFFLQLIGLISPLFTQVIIDTVLVHRGTSTLDILIIGMLIVSFFQGWVGYLRTYLFVHTTNRIDVSLGTRLFKHVTALPLSFFETRRVGEVIARIRELDNLRRFITGSGLTVVLDSFMACVFVVAMFIYSAKLSVVALLALPVFVLLSLLVTPLYRRQLNDQFLSGAENQAFLVESITGIQTVKSMAVEQQFIGRWEDRLARYIKTSFAVNNFSNIVGNTGSLINKLFNLAVLWLGARMCMDGTLTVGQLIAFQMFAAQVTGPVLRLVNLWQSFQQARLSINRLGDILNENPEPAFDPNRTTLPSIQGDIVLDKVTFRYRPGAKEVLRQVNLHIAAGSHVGIVGRSGSGKSTLTKLIQRLYTPESGRVLIDGVDLAQVEPAWLRRQIGVVPQESFLFNGTVKENIAAADLGATEERVVWAAQLAGAHEFIMALPEGYNSNVGERGEALSGGQRQRIAIARAIINDPALLIFDEATSALDYESERIIQDHLASICANRTVIMIAHRLSTVRFCNPILVFDQGQLVEQGSHEQLLDMKGIYWELHRQQAG